MKSVYEKIIELLDSESISYSVHKHEPVHTSLEASKVRETSLATGAKALIWFADKKPVLIVVPGDRRLDTKKFKEAFGIKDLRFATPEEVLNLTTLKIGSIPPLGLVLGLPSYFDATIAKSTREVAFNAGLHTVSIVMSAGDLVKIIKPKVAEIT